MGNNYEGMRINGHSHLLPYPEEIPSFMKENEIFWIDEDRKHMLQKGWKRPVTDSSFFLNEKLEWMERFVADNTLLDQERCLLSQLFALDDTKTVEAAIKDLSEDAEILEFKRVAVG